MKKVFALLAISGMAALYACSSGEKKEETTTTTEQTEQTQQTETQVAPADSVEQAAPTDTTKK